ncbi:DNA binding domain protein, excisionase family, partial [mine drainage metagenome]
MERLYTLRDACEILQVDPATLRKWDREGKVRCIRLQNNYRRVPESEINRILGSGKRKGNLTSMQESHRVGREMILRGRLRD